MIFWSTLNFGTGERLPKPPFRKPPSCEPPILLVKTTCESNMGPKNLLVGMTAHVRATWDPKITLKMAISELVAQGVFREAR